MPDSDNLEKVMLLTEGYRVLGEIRLGPDGSLWDFKHRPNEFFVTVFNAQCFRLSDGKRMYDATEVELCKTSIVAVFKQRNLAFVRKEGT